MLKLLSLNGTENSEQHVTIKNNKYRHMKNAILLFAALTFVSCAKKDGKLVLVESNGRMNQLLVVMNNDLWDNTEGEALKEALNEDVHGLPQKEPQFNVTHVEVNGFGHLFKRSKSILNLYH